MSLKVNIETDAFIKTLGKYGKKAEQAAKSGVHAIAESIILTAKIKYVPVDTGALKNSGTVLYTRLKQNKVVSMYGFGGPAAPYARFVHDRTLSSKNNPIKHTVGQAKYLEASISEWKPRIISGIVSVMKQRLG